MNNFLFLYSLSILIIIVLTIIGFRFFSKEEDRKYSFYNCLPNELFVSSNKRIIIFRIIYVVPLLLLSFSALCLFFINNNPIYNPQLGLFVLLIFLGCISFILLYFLTTNNIKSYLFFFVLLIVSSLMSLASISFIGFMSLTDKSLISLDVKKIVVASVSLLIFLVFLFMIIKGMRKPLFEMNKVIKDNEVYYERPKKFLVAYMQWISLGILYLSTLLGLLLFI